MSLKNVHTGVRPYGVAACRNPSAWRRPAAACTPEAGEVELQIAVGANDLQQCLRRLELLG